MDRDQEDNLSEYVRVGTSCLLLNEASLGGTNPC